MCKKINFVYMIDRTKLAYFDFFLLGISLMENSTTTPSINFSEIFHWQSSYGAGCMNVGRRGNGDVCLLGCFLPQKIISLSFLC